jgi:hypothetical protein
MNGFSLLLTIASLGVVYSWRTGVDQQQEYVLQIEPEIVQALSAGEEIFSDVPADAGSLARLCITVLPKDGIPARHTAAGEERFRQLIVASGRYASRDVAPVTSDSQATILWPARAGGTPDQNFGVTTGWQPDNNGNQQYVVQIDPTVLSTLSIGDEIYVPVDPAAGRLARFVVKAGRGTLPRIGGRSPALLTQAPMPNNANEFTRNTWNTSAVDSTNQPARFGNNVNDRGFNDRITNDPRNSQFNQPPGYTQPNYGSTPIPPGNSYTGFGQPTGTTPGFDSFRAPPLQNPETPPVPNYTFQPVANQQPQLPPPLPPAQRPAFNNYPDNRMAGLPPNNPNSMFPPFNNAANLQQQQDKPWGPLLFVTFALFFSIGGNLYLAYTALEFHSRYRSAIERLRSAARSA